MGIGFDAVLLLSWTMCPGVLTLKVSPQVFLYCPAASCFFTPVLNNHLHICREPWGYIQGVKSANALDRQGHIVAQRQLWCTAWTGRSWAFNTKTPLPSRCMGTNNIFQITLLYYNQNFGIMPSRFLDRAGKTPNSIVQNSPLQSSPSQDMVKVNSIGQLADTRAAISANLSR